MKQRIVLSVLAVVAIAMTACFGPGPNPEEVEFKQADLLGLWQEQNTEVFVRFTNTTTAANGTRAKMSLKAT